MKPIFFWVGVMTLLSKFENHLNTDVQQSAMTKFELIMACQDENWSFLALILSLFASTGLSVGVGILFSSLIPAIVLCVSSVCAVMQYATHCETKYSQQKRLSEKEKDDVLDMIKELSLDPKYANVVRSYIEKFETEEPRAFWHGFKGLMSEYYYFNKRKSVIEEINHNIDHVAQIQEVRIDTARATISNQSLKV